MDETFTPVERSALDLSPASTKYPPNENIPVIVVPDFPALGRLTALSFLEWVQQNPEGVISLPTGKTPEQFIKWTHHLLETWEKADTQNLLTSCGIEPDMRPEMSGLRFVQIDEFYPIDPKQENSFCHYVNRFYIKGLGLDPARAMCIDCSSIGLEKDETIASVWPSGVDMSLRDRSPDNTLEQRQKRMLGSVDLWCEEYENSIRDMGGIGFFLGGIGPDGHIAFNLRGSDHTSRTRLLTTNYETQAASATDLGGIETARKIPVITIGLGTITFNSDCKAIIMAAGMAKCRIVAKAIEQPPHPTHPATALQTLKNARFYLSSSAAANLQMRRFFMLSARAKIAANETERILIDIALATDKRIDNLDTQDIAADRFGRLLVKRLTAGGVKKQGTQLHRSLCEKIEAGTCNLKNKSFLHTEPHHDDILLGYLPAVLHNMGNGNTHHFATMTSGFTSVTNTYLTKRLTALQSLMNNPKTGDELFDGFFVKETAGKDNPAIQTYLTALEGYDTTQQDRALAQVLLRDIISIYGLHNLGEVRQELDHLLHYLADAYPGKKDPKNLQDLKGACREWEAECLWASINCDSSRVHHLRLGFYTGEIFAEEPTEQRDVLPILQLLERTEPDILTVALDPEGSGPDTHYRTLMAVRAAVERYEGRNPISQLKIWGYRNIWTRFHPSESDICVPVSSADMDRMKEAFHRFFATQRDASFPSYEFDGPFDVLARRIQEQQLAALTTCLGDRWFSDHETQEIREAIGLVYLKEMSVETFRDHCRKLQDATEGNKPITTHVVSKEVYAAVDIGAGSGTKLGIFDSKLQPLRETILPVANYGDSATEFLDTLASLLLEQLRRNRGEPTAIGIACPGLFCSDGAFRPLINLPFLNNVRVGPELGARLGVPSFSRNDADAGAFGEWTQRQHALLYWAFGGGWGGAWISEEGKILPPPRDWYGDESELHYTSEPGYAIPLEKVSMTFLFEKAGVSFDTFLSLCHNGKTDQAHLVGPSGKANSIRAETILSGLGRWRLFQLFSAEDESFKTELNENSLEKLKSPQTAGKIISHLGRLGIEVAVRTDILFGTVLSQAAMVLFRQAEQNGLAPDAPVYLAGGVSHALPLFGPTAQNLLDKAGFSHRLKLSVLESKELDPNLFGAAAMAKCEH